MTPRSSPALQAALEEMPTSNVDRQKIEKQLASSVSIEKMIDSLEQQMLTLLDFPNQESRQVGLWMERVAIALQNLLPRNITVKLHEVDRRVA